MKICDALFENIDFSLRSDEMAPLLSSCLSVRVTAEKCSVRSVEDLLATKGRLTDGSQRLVTKPRWGYTMIKSR